MKSNTLKEELRLPRSGRVVPNRLVKAATTEQMADPLTNLPNPALCQASACFAQGGVGMFITGNVHVDRNYMEASRNVAAEEKDLLDANAMKQWSAYAKACQNQGKTIAIVQLSHGGRQVPRSVNWQTSLAPSEGSMDLPGIPKHGLPAPFAPPKAATIDDIEDIKQRFLTASLLVAKAGFDGVEVHAAHGYLLSSFLSPKVNRRDDIYGGNAEHRAKLLLDICQLIRETLPPTFIIGVKLNSADFQKGGFSEEESLSVSQRLAQLGVDFIEYSGGTYESAVMVKDPEQVYDIIAKNNAGAVVKESTLLREAFFIDYVNKAREALRNENEVVILLTGGWRSAKAMHSAVANQTVDLIGIARPLCVEPTFANRLLAWNPTDEEDVVAMQYTVTKPYSFLPKELQDSLGSQVQSFWHTMQIHRYGQGLEAEFNFSFAPFLVKSVQHLYFDPQKYPVFLQTLKITLFATGGLLLAMYLQQK